MNKDITKASAAEAKKIIDDAFEKRDFPFLVYIIKVFPQNVAIAILNNWFLRIKAEQLKEVCYKFADSTNSFPQKEKIYKKKEENRNKE